MIFCSKKESKMDKKILFRNILLWLILIGLMFPLRAVYMHYAVLLSLEEASYAVFLYAYIAGGFVMCMDFSSGKINIIIFLLQLILVIYNIWNPILLFSSTIFILIHGVVLGIFFLSIFFQQRK